MTHEFRSKLLHKTIILIFGLFVIGIIASPWLIQFYIDIVGEPYATDSLALYLSVVITSGLLTLAILYELKRIVESVIKKDVFVHRNVISLKRISKIAIFVSVIFLIKLIFSFGVLTLAASFAFFFIALFCYVVADVFIEAINFKEENELTI
jgi:MFS family permease